MTPVRLEPAASLSQVKHSTTETLRSLYSFCACIRNITKIVMFGMGKMKLVPFGQGNVAFNINNICKGHLGSRGGEASKNRLKDTSFIFSMTNVTILGVFRKHAQKKYGKVLEMKSTYILNILALLLF